MKEWLGFFEGGSLIMKLPRNARIIAQVTKTEEGTLVAETLPYKEYQDIEKMVKGKKDIKRKILIIFGIIIFYFLMLNIFYKITKDVRVFAQIFGAIFTFGVVGGYPLYKLLNDFTYATMNKEKMQYAYLFKKLEECYIQRKEINEENLKKQDIVQGTLVLKMLIWALVLSICNFLIRDIFIVVTISIELIIGIILMEMMQKSKLKKVLIKLMISLVYRKPTEEQIDTFLFAYKYLKQEEENYEF